MKKIFTLTNFLFVLALSSFSQKVDCSTNDKVNFSVDATNISLTPHSVGYIEFNMLGTPPFNFDVKLKDTTIHISDIADHYYKHEINAEILAYLLTEIPEEVATILVSDSLGCSTTFIGDLTAFKTSILVTPSDCDTNSGAITISLPETNNETPLSYTCDLTHNSTASFDVNDGLTHCITAYGLIENININNGSLVILDSVVFKNIVLNKVRLINNGSITFEQTFNGNPNGIFYNYGTITANQDFNINGIVENHGKIAVNNSANITSNRIMNSYSDFSAKRLQVDGTLNLKHKNSFEYVLNNGKIQLTNATLTTTSLYNDGKITRTDSCSGIYSESIRGNVKISPLLICTGNCKCEEVNASLSVVWEDGFVGASRTNLSPGTYNVDIISSTEEKIRHQIIVPYLPECYEEQLSISELKDYFMIYPNPQARESVQNFEVSLTTKSFVKLEIYNDKGINIETPFNGLLEKGIHTFEWLGEKDHSGHAIYVCIIWINGEAQRKFFLNTK